MTNPTREQILEALSNGPLTFAELKTQIEGLNGPATLTRMVSEGIIISTEVEVIRSVKTKVTSYRFKGEGNGNIKVDMDKPFRKDFIQYLKDSNFGTITEFNAIFGANLASGSVSALLRAEMIEKADKVEVAKLAFTKVKQYALAE